MDMTPEEHKELIKTAIKEWLEEKFSQFGKWTLKSLGAMCFGVILLYLLNHGYHFGAEG